MKSGEIYFRNLQYGVFVLRIVFIHYEIYNILIGRLIYWESIKVLCCNELVCNKLVNASQEYVCF